MKKEKLKWSLSHTSDLALSPVDFVKTAPPEEVQLAYARANNYEPWPCAAGNSLINWPCEPKDAFYAVKSALRPTLLSVCSEKSKWIRGEKFKGTLWILNDSPETTENITFAER